MHQLTALQELSDREQLKACVKRNAVKCICILCYVLFLLKVNEILRFSHLTRPSTEVSNMEMIAEGLPYSSSKWRISVCIMQISIRGMQNITSQLITQWEHGVESCKVLDGFN